MMNMCTQKHVIKVTFRVLFIKTPFVRAVQKNAKKHLSEKKADDNTSLLIISREGASEGQRQKQRNLIVRFFLLFFTLSAFAFFLRAASSPLSVRGKTALSPSSPHPKQQQQQKQTHRPRVYTWSRYWGAGAKNISPALKDDATTTRFQTNRESTHIQKINVRRE